MNEKSEKSGTRAAEGTVEVTAPVELVWKALTEAEELERWFPLEARVVPGLGGTVFMSWRNEYAGESAIVAWEEGRHLRTEWGFEGEGPERAVQYTDYWLEGRRGTTVLRVVTSGFPADPAWDEWYEGTRRGWAFELRSLKHYLERHRGEDRDVIYLRRRVRMKVEAAWRRLWAADGVAGRLPGGVPFIDEPPHILATHVPDLGDGLLRLTPEVCTRGAQYRDVTLWLQAYGLGRECLAELRREWGALLERLFPDGETV